MLASVAPGEEAAALRALVADYLDAAALHHSRPFVSPPVLAELVRAGWRRTK